MSLRLIVRNSDPGYHYDVIGKLGENVRERVNRHGKGKRRDIYGTTLDETIELDD